MSALENATKDFLGPMIVGHVPTTLTPEQQKTLATWAVKTAYMLEMTFRQKYPRHVHVPGYEPSEAELTWLWNRHEPPPRSRVWLSCIDAEFKAAVRYEPSEAPLPARGREPLLGHLTTIAIGFVVLQVHTVNYVDAEHDRARWFIPPPCPPEISSSITSIWPSPLRTLQWPKECFQAEDWPRLVTWQGTLREKY